MCQMSFGTSVCHSREGGNQLNFGHIFLDVCEGRHDSCNFKSLPSRLFGKTLWPVPKKEVGHVILGDMPHLNIYSVRQANGIRREGCLRFNLFCVIPSEETLQILGGASHIQENEPQFGLGPSQHCQYSIFPNSA